MGEVSQTDYNGSGEKVEYVKAKVALALMMAAETKVRCRLGRTAQSATLLCPVMARSTSKQKSTQLWIAAAAHTNWTPRSTQFRAANAAQRRRMGGGRVGRGARTATRARAGTRTLTAHPLRAQVQLLAVQWRLPVYGDSHALV